MSEAATKWDQLTAAAVLGTGRAAPGETLFQGSGELGRILSGAKDHDAEMAVLNSAAVLRTYLRAGSRCLTTKAQPVQPAGPEKLPVCSLAAENLLARLFRGECVEVLPEALALLSGAKQRVPERLIPRLLDRASELRDIRAAAKATVGERGRWLAEQNPEWSWLLVTTVDIGSIWETGTLDQRAETLKLLRAEEPAPARQLLQTTWAQDPPEHRAAFVAILRIGLSHDDAEFLELALDDKRKDVRRSAADLLARLPNSQLCQRMRQRVAPLLNFRAGKKSKLLKALGQKASIDVALPDGCDKAMQRDGIEPKPPHSKIGEKAWWVQQMLSAVPPATWFSGWSTSPEEFIGVAKESEWCDALLDGWSLASARHADAAWINALLEQWIGSMSIGDASARADVIEQMMQALPTDSADGLLVRLTRRKDLHLYQSPVLLMLRATKFDWSGELSRLVVQAMLRAFDSWCGHEGEITRAASDCFCIRMSPSVVTEAEKGRPEASPHWLPHNAKQLNTFLDILRFRNELHREIKP